MDVAEGRSTDFAGHLRRIVDQIEQVAAMIEAAANDERQAAADAQEQRAQEADGAAIDEQAMRLRGLADTIQQALGTLIRPNHIVYMERDADDKLTATITRQRDFRVDLFEKQTVVGYVDANTIPEARRFLDDMKDHRENRRNRSTI